jgi:hypothetical protein
MAGASRRAFSVAVGDRNPKSHRFSARQPPPRLWRSPSAACRDLQPHGSRAIDSRGHRGTRRSSRHPSVLATSISLISGSAASSGRDCRNSSGPSVIPTLGRTLAVTRDCGGHQGCRSTIRCALPARSRCWVSCRGRARRDLQVPAVPDRRRSAGLTLRFRHACSWSYAAATASVGEHPMSVRSRNRIARGLWVLMAARTSVRDRSSVGRELALRPECSAQARMPPTARPAPRGERRGVTGFDCGAGALFYGVTPPAGDRAPI